MFCAARPVELIEGLVEFALVARYEFVLASEQVKYGDHGVFGRAFGEVGLAFDDAEPGRKRLFKLSFGRLTAGHLVARF